MLQECYDSNDMCAEILSMNYTQLVILPSRSIQIPSISCSIHLNFDCLFEIKSIIHFSVILNRSRSVLSLSHLDLNSPTLFEWYAT